MFSAANWRVDAMGIFEPPGIGRCDATATDPCKARRVIGATQMVLFHVDAT